MNTTDALRELARFGVEPDLVYIDADHGYEAVKADIECVTELFPRAVVVGDDWSWDGVRQAATEHAVAHGRQIEQWGNAWRFKAAAR
jgi:hypothetical protein